MSLFMHMAGKKKGGLLFFLSHRKNIPEELKKKHLDLLAEEGGGGKNPESSWRGVAHWIFIYFYKEITQFNWWKCSEWDHSNCWHNPWVRCPQSLPLMAEMHGEKEVLQHRR